MKRINKRALVFVIAIVALIMSCFVIFALADDGDKVDAMIEINADEKLQGAFLKKMTLADDGYIGIPVELSFYYDYATHGKAIPVGHLDPDGDAVALYVVNANVERIGTKSDTEIIGGLLDRGYVVAVLDYLNNEKAETPDIDWSAQRIRDKLYKGEYFSDISDKVGVGKYITNFIIPAGYDVMPYQVFWEIDKHGADGDLEKIVENWNTDFRSSQQKDKLVYWADADGNRKATWNAPDGTSPVWLNASGKEDANGKYIKLKYTKAESIGDCVNPDGTPIDLNLYAHVIYPTNPEKAVPVMNLASCGLYLSSAKTSEDEYCDFTGFLFNGYAGMIYDYLWYPMARQFGVYDGNSKNGAVTGDHMNYSLHLWNDKLVNTAAMRYIRHLAVDESETFKFDTDHMGVIGLSKGSWFDFLGEAELRNYTVSDPENYTDEELMELIDARIAAYTPKRYLEGHHGETRYQAGNTASFTDGVMVIDGGERQPWLLYETTGEEILAFTSYNYTACGTNQEDITAGHVPMFNSHAMNDSFGNARSTVGPLAANMNIPTLDFVCDIYHAMAYGPDEHYGIDTYRAQFAFANYFLKNTPISVAYVDPVANSTGLKINEDIVIAFAGTVSYEAMLDVTLTDELGNAVSGDWICSRGGTTWTFRHDTLEGGKRYTLTVPEGFKGTNGKEMGENYVALFETVKEYSSDVEVHDNYAVVTVPSNIKSGVKLGFTVEDDAYNTADIYLVSAVGESVGELVGSVNVSGKGVYAIDITSVAAKNVGKTLTFLIKAKRAVSDAYTYEGKDYSFGARINRSEVADGDSTVYRITVGDNGGYTVPGYDEKKNVFYSNLTTVFSNSNILGTSKITAADMGRKFTVTVNVLDSISRVVMLSLNDTNNATEETIDLTSQRYNYKTEAGKWTTLTFEYTVYEPSYGDTVGSQVKKLTVSASPTGDTLKPMWFGTTAVRETLTDLNVASAYISVYDDGYAYKADSGEGAFLVGETYYDSFAAALSAAGNGGTVTLTANYTVNSAAEAIEIAKANNVTVDLNGYSVRAVGASPVNLAATNKDALTVTIKNGTVYLYNNAFLGYASQTAAASGKKVNLNLENITVSNVDGSRLTGFMTEKALTKDVRVEVNVSLTDCDIKVDAYSNINVNFEVFGTGTKNLFVTYTVKGGTLTMDSFARAYLTKSTGSVSYVKDADGEYTRLILSKGTPAPAKRLSALTDVYGEFKLSEVSGLVATYAIVTNENSTKYGVIPEEYSDADVYPFVYFDNMGTFRGAATQLFGTENGAFIKCKNLNTKNNVWDEVNETYGARPYASYILMRRDYAIGDEEYDWNFAQNQGTTTLDLNGFTLTKNSTSSSKMKVVFPGTAKAFTGTEDAYVYPSSFVVENGKIVTNVPLLSMNLYGTTYDLTKKVMNFTFNDLEIVAAEGTTTTRFLHQIDNAPTGAKGPAIFNIEYNDCIFDLRGYTSPASDTRIFNVNTTEATMINMQLRVNGGTIKANDFANLTLQKLDSYYGSSITFDKGESGTYTALELAETATVLPSGTVNTPEGGKVYSKKASADGIDTYLLSGKITEYGAVPDEYTDGTEYPFLVFANGDFKGAYKYWADSDGTVNSAIERAVELANGANGVGVKVTILLQSDFANTRGNADNNSLKFGTFTGELTVDLGGHTLTAGAWMLFSFNGQLVNGKLYDSKITVKDGTLEAGNKVIFAVEQYNTAWTEASHGRKLIDVTFGNVTFAQSPNYSTEKVPFLENTTNTSPIDFKALYEDCVFDYDNHASGTAFTMLNFSSSGGVKADITIKGGTLEASTLENFNFSKLSTGDSVKFEKNSEGEYMIAKVAEAGASTTSNFTADNGKNLNLAHWDTKDGRKLYKLVSLVTEYGTIPAANASLVDYPFAVFKDGTFLGAYAYFADAYDGDTNSAVERAKNQMHGAGGAGKTVTILMRRDFVNLDGKGAGGTSTLGHYNNFSQVGGTLNIDLGGYTLTAGTWMLFCLQAKTVNGAIFDTTINVKNGTLHTGNKVLIAMESTSTDYSSLGTKVFKMTFEDVTIGHSPNYATEKASIILNNTTNANPVKLDVTFKNCVFDYESHKSGSKVTLLDFKKNGGVSLDAEFIGGEFRMSTFSNYNIATLDADDVLVFGPDSNGNYTKANVANGGTITNVDYKTVNGKTYNFGLMNDTTTTDTYVLMDLNTEYGKIPAQYANPEKYPFIIFDKTGYRFAATEFYGTQAGSSAISRAIYSITAASNAWDAVNKTYGDDANYAVILMRRDYTLSSTEKHDNLAHNQGTITIDLGGYTLTSANDKYMFSPTIKRWPAADSGDTAEVFPSYYIVKNGTLVSVNKSLIAFNTTNSGTINLFDKTFGWQFDNVTFKNTGSAANPFLACFYQTGLVKIPTPVIYNNCTFDLSNVTGAKSVFNIDTDHDVLLQLTVNGGKIIAPANIAHLDVLRKIDKNGSTIVFGKGNDGFFKLITSAAYTNGEALPTTVGDASFVKVGESDGKNVYSLVPKVLTGFTPKMSLTLDRNLIMNVYVPKEGLQKFTLDGTEYADLAAIVENIVTLDDGKDYYLIKIELPAKSAARVIALSATVAADGLSSNVSFTFGIAKYAEKILADTEISETEKTLTRDVLSYARAAYVYFNMTDNDEMIAKIDAILGDSYDENNAPVMNGSAEAPTEGLESATFVLSSTPAIRFYLPSDADASAYSFYANGTVLPTEVGENENGKYIDIDVYAYRMCDTITYKIDNVERGSFHIKAYYEWAKDQNNEALVNVVSRFAKYCESAKAYRAEFISALGCEHSFVLGVCTKCGEADPDYVPDYGTVTLTAPEVLYSNYPAKELSVTFSKPEYASAITYTTDNANVFVENGKIYATGTFASEVTVIVTATTEHHTATATVKVSTYDGGISAEKKIQYYEANIIKEENKGGMIFVGDSYVDGYTIDAPPFWRDFYRDFADEKAFLMGLSSSQIHQLEIASERIVYPMEPSEIVINIGHNDLHHGSLTVDQFVARLTALMNEYHERLPEAKIYFFSVAPKKIAETNEDRFVSSFEKAPAANAAIKALAEQHDWLYYVDTTDIFYSNGENLVNENMFPGNDNSHPSLVAYDLMRIALNEARGINEQYVTHLTSLSAIKFKDAAGKDISGDFAASGKLVITGLVKNNSHIHFRFHSNYRFVLWDASSDGVFGAGYIKPGASVNDKGSVLYDANEGIVLNWTVITKDNKAYWYINGQLMQTFDSYTPEYFLIGGSNVNALIYDVELNVKADDAEAYDAHVARYADDVINLETYGYAPIVNKTFTDRDGNALTENYIIKGKLDIIDFPKDNTYIQFVLKSGYRFLLWDSNNDGKFGAGYTENGNNVSDTASGIKLYNANGGLTLDWMVIVDEGSASFYINGEFIKKFKSESFSEFKIGASQMNAKLYDIELYVMSDDKEAYGAERAKYPDYAINNLNSTDGTNITNTGFNLTDASGNDLTDNYIAKGTLTITDIALAQAHLQFRFGQGCRFLLWDASSDGVFGAGYMYGSNASDKTDGVKLYDANGGLTLEWAIIMNEGTAYWYLDGELVRTMENPKLEMLNVGALKMNVAFYNTEIYTKAENANVYDVELARYFGEVIDINMYGNGKNITENGHTFTYTDTQGVEQSLVDDYVIRGKLNISKLNKSNAHIQFSFNSNNRFLIWDSNSDGMVGVGYSDEGSYQNEVQLGSKLYDATAGITFDWAIVMNGGTAYWYLNGELAYTFKFPTSKPERFNIGVLQANISIYDVEMIVGANDQAAFENAVAEYLG